MAVVWILAIMVCWGIVLLRWRSGVVMLLAYLPLSGVVTLLLYPDPLPILIKDFFFVIPAYLAFFLARRNETSQENIPVNISIVMLALCAMVLIQSFNPGIPNWLVAFIGAKVWLFYLPLIFLTFAMIDSRHSLIGLLRLMVVSTWIPCVVGIVQWLACMNFGYVETMTFFYGDAAEKATQRFASFDVGGTFFRIPSTFTFVTQYFGFTLAMIVPAYALMKLDTSKKWHKFAMITLGLTVLASLMSGSRSAYLFVPLLLGLIVFLEGSFSGVMKIMVILPLVSLIAMFVAGIDPIRMFDMMQWLFLRYSDEIAKQGLLDAITSSPFGSGTGMNTGPARYAVEAPDAFGVIENYYAKAVVELGIVGLVIVAGLFLAIALRGYRILKHMRDAGLRSCAAVFLAFIITMMLSSFKGWQIDLDPVNVYFWVFSGIMLKLGYLDKLAQVSGGASPDSTKEYRGDFVRRPRHP